MTATPHDDRPKAVRLLYVGAGGACLVLGAAGALLPLLPTTPFVLLAAACFARSSPAFHRALRESKLFGPVLRDWEDHRSIPRDAKVKGIVVVVLVFASSIVWALETPGPRWAMGALGASLVAFLLWLPTTPEAAPAVASADGPVGDGPRAREGAPDGDVA